MADNNVSRVLVKCICWFTGQQQKARANLQITLELFSIDRSDLLVSSSAAASRQIALSAHTRAVQGGRGQRFIDFIIRPAGRGHN